MCDFEEIETPVCHPVKTQNYNMGGNVVTI